MRPKHASLGCKYYKLFLFIVIALCLLYLLLASSFMPTRVSHRSSKTSLQRCACSHQAIGSNMSKREMKMDVKCKKYLKAESHAKIQNIPESCEILTNLATAFNLGDDATLQEFIDSKVSPLCTLKAPCMQQPIQGRSHVMHFWRAVLRGMPDSVVQHTQFSCSNQEHKAKAKFMFCGTRLFHRESDILFSRKLARGANVDDPETPAKWAPWPADIVQTILHRLTMSNNEGDNDKDDTFATAPDITGFVGYDVEKVVANGSVQITMDDNSMITHFEYDWTIMEKVSSNANIFVESEL